MKRIAQAMAPEEQIARRELQKFPVVLTLGNVKEAGKVPGFQINRQKMSWGNPFSFSP